MAKMKNMEYKDYNLHLKNTVIKSKRQFEIYENYYRKNLLKFLPTDKRITIVDIGCGLGHFLYFLKKNNFQNIQGIDLVEENVKFCKKKGFKVMQKDIFNYIKSTKEKSDLFVLSNFLEHFSYNQIIEIINSLSDLLNDEGKIIIIIPNCNNILGLATYFSDITHKSPLTEKSFEDLILKTRIKKYSFHNLIVYPNIPIIDSLIGGYNKILFIMRRINNLLNGQKPFKVQSKNLLAILEKTERWR